MGKAHVDLPKQKIAEFCRRNHIRKLSLFGSVLHGDFRPDSDGTGCPTKNLGHDRNMMFMCSYL